MAVSLAWRLWQPMQVALVTGASKAVVATPATLLLWQSVQTGVPAVSAGQVSPLPEFQAAGLWQSAQGRAV
jgi:hypothetical protein